MYKTHMVYQLKIGSKNRKIIWIAFRKNKDIKLNVLQCLDTVALGALFSEI